MRKEKNMEYRILPHGGEKISVLGLGTAYVGDAGEQNVTDTVSYAMDQGINYIDMAGSKACIFAGVGRAMKGRRDQLMVQVHFGADYSTGEYGWDLSLESVKRSVDWQIRNLDTDYVDFGYMHCLDEVKDLKDYEKNGVLEYLLGMKKQGVVRHLGLSTHSPELANRVLDMGLVDMIMYSINPMYDYGQGEFAMGGAGERYELYRRCEKEGVGITVMKPFSGGLLLDAAKSPFHHALTPAQCIQYVLDRPGVLTTVMGCSNVEEVKQNLAWLDASEEEKDYSVIGTFTPGDTKGKCVYCRHCHPCPMGLDIALINKYYDLSKLGDELAKEHYRTMELHASDCLQCGHCNDRCPFHVDQMARMQEISGYFGF